MRIDTTPAAGWRFGCLPGCGLCCATSPQVLPDEEARTRAAGLPVARRADGTVGLRMRGNACAALGSDLACGAYAARPFPCRTFPVQLHALERVQAALHLGCPGLGRAGSEDGEALARRTAEEALRRGALDAASAQRNARLLRDRARALGHPESGREVAEAFAGLDPVDPATLAGLYAAAAVPTLSLDDVPDAVEEGAQGGRGALAGLLGEVAREVPRRAVSYVDAALAWKPLDLSRADAAAALRPPGPMQPALAAHAARWTGRDLTWGHALRLVDATGYAVSPSSAYARTLADLASALLLAAQATGDAAQAVGALEAHYWSLPTVGAAL